MKTSIILLINTFFFPTHVDEMDFKSYRKKDKNKVLFVGSLFIPVNMEGVKWYLNFVHDKVLKKYRNYTLIIAGNTGNNKRAICNFLNKYYAVEFYDTPSDNKLEELYDESKVFIVPIFQSAGVKIKVINSIKKGLPIVSTSNGVNGTGFENKKHVLIADRPYDFAESISLLFKNNEMCEFLVKNAQKFISDFYNEEKILREII